MYERIRELREDKDITQAQMGEILNCAQSTYSKYESGKLDIPSKMLIKLAQFHGVTVDYLLGLEKKKKL